MSISPNTTSTKITIILVDFLYSLLINTEIKIIANPSKEALLLSINNSNINAPINTSMPIFHSLFFLPWRYIKNSIAVRIICDTEFLELYAYTRDVQENPLLNIVRYTNIATITPEKAYTRSKSFN